MYICSPLILNDHFSLNLSILCSLINLGELGRLYCKWYVYLCLFGVLPGKDPRQFPQLRAYRICDGGATDHYLWWRSNWPLCSDHINEKLCRDGRTTGKWPPACSLSPKNKIATPLISFVKLNWERSELRNPEFLQVCYYMFLTYGSWVLIGHLLHFTP